MSFVVILIIPNLIGIRSSSPIVNEYVAGLERREGKVQIDGSMEEVKRLL